MSRTISGEHLFVSGDNGAALRVQSRRPCREALHCSGCRVQHLVSTQNRLTALPGSLHITDPRTLEGGCHSPRCFTLTPKTCWHSKLPSSLFFLGSSPGDCWRWSTSQLKTDLRILMLKYADHLWRGRYGSGNSSCFWGGCLGDCKDPGGKLLPVKPIISLSVYKLCPVIYI